MRIVDTGAVAGWVRDGRERRVLLLHGGPGIGFEYLDPLAEEIGPTWTVASFQQRGLSPSTLGGPFDLDTAVADVAAFLDALGWEQTVLLGHSWGGHLALHATVALPDRVSATLAVEPLGAVGDGGEQAFDDALLARTAPAGQARLAHVTDPLEIVRILWPAYCADPAAPAPVPEIRLSAEASDGLWPDLRARLSALAAALPEVAVPLGLVSGGSSPMPAALDVLDLVPGAWLEVVDGAGHFPWIERPGRVGAALERLTS